MTIRLAHISDLHVPVRKPGWGLRDLFSKRATGWVNVRLLGRGRRFRRAAEVIEAIQRSFRQHEIGHVLFSGDASMMGFPREFEAVANLLGVQEMNGLAVPGNHDYYVRRRRNQGAFERSFAPWQRGVRLDESEVYPFAQNVNGVWFVAINSAQPNSILWDARGGVGRMQRERLAKLLKSLPAGKRVIVTHYPLLLSNGQPESRWRKMRDWKEMRSLCADAGVSLWLHGHRHHSYTLPCQAEDYVWLEGWRSYPPPAGESKPFPCVCVGSSTQVNRWSYHEYRFEADVLIVLPRQFDPVLGEFVDREPKTLKLPG